jgi:nicotinate-nucleotide adenylyltransferase
MEALVERLKRIALYGGTFDPVHIGHIAVARGLLKLFALDELLFIPAHVAPHKRGANVTPALYRYAMLVLATQQEERFRVSTIELDAPGRPYTVETLSRLKAEVGRGARLFFVMGADSWTEITTWREWERVLALTNQIVVTRPGYQLSADHVTPAVRQRIVDLRGMNQDEITREVDHSDDELKIYVTDAVFMEVSATAIRNLAHEGRDPELVSLVPPPVAEFIRKYRLYRDQA